MPSARRAPPINASADGSGAVSLGPLPTIYDDWYDVAPDGRSALGGTVTVIDLVSGRQRALGDGFFPHWVAGLE